MVLGDSQAKRSEDHQREMVQTCGSSESPPTADSIIADLTFGFWPYLFEKRYHDLWWGDGEHLLKAVFPHLPSSVHPSRKIGRADVFERVSLFAELRNRSMHHEPILFGIPRPNLGTPAPVMAVNDIHAQMVELLSWIDPTLVSALSIVDRFTDVHQFGRQIIEDKLRRQLGLD
ncbi:MAG: hypothetical protein ACR2OO_07280 [Thermomicrobiales bacterium]